jgi:acetylornithine deacetylase
MMHAVASFREQGVTPPCEVWLAAAADEEYSFRGVLKLCEGLQADAAVVAEPTELRLVIASKGVVRWKIGVKGKAAHSSKPHLGVNAIVHMARIVDALEKEAEGLTAVRHPLLGSATMNVGVIRGGVQVNFVPDWCEIEIDRRLLPGERIDAVLADYQRLLDRLQSAEPSLTAAMQAPMLADDALETSPDAPVARVASAVLGGLGLNPEACGVPYGSDASKLSRHGVPSIIFGPGSIDRAHAAEEYVECDQVALAAEFYREFLIRFE